MRIMDRVRQKQERGAALVLALFALLLLSALGAFMFVASSTESHIDSNYRGSLNAYYAANGGLLEIRDRLKYTSVTPGGLADRVPRTIAGTSGGVLYVLNPANGEAVDPTDPANKYFDTQLCHDYNSGVEPGAKCTSAPGVSGWNLPAQNAMPVNPQLNYKWVRLNMKTNRIAAPYYVDQTGSSAPLDTPVCWDGRTEQLSPGGANPACDANGMQSVYMLTSLAASPGLNASRRLLRFEVVAPSIRPPGAITLDAGGLSPNLGNSSASIPTTAVDGRPHRLDGTLTSGTGGCSAVAAMGTDNAQVSTQLAQALNALRQSIVQAANNSCNADGSGMNSNVCTPALWWVRGTDSQPRFATTTTSTVTTTTTTSSGSGDHHDGDHSGTSTATTTTTTSTVTSPCDSTNAACYTWLNLGAPELQALPNAPASYAPHIPIVTLPPNPSAPFAGAAGNQADPTLYQTGLPATVPNEIDVLRALVAASANRPNYYALSAANLASSYGSAVSPAVVVITDISFKLTSGSLTGFGVLVVPNDFEISNAALNWTGIVLVSGSNSQFLVGSGAQGFINGALLMQTGSTANLTTAGSNNSSFRISYSCDAIDMAFSSLPFKVISSAEFSF